MTSFVKGFTAFFIAIKQYWELAQIYPLIHKDAQISDLDADMPDLARVAHRFCSNSEEYLWNYS